ncbi:unnamed protein product [Clonostachys rosea]|uniref:F-box domain-containing protein n=1 Tax=Bionectria ochroleuca TaxID=29856 RepID=A0ABY6UIR7_BIOOC|nr:unnamed protein product [Clonostachys rosea]
MSTFESLPVEVVLRVGTMCDPESRINFSMTSRNFRLILVDLIFRSIKIAETQGSLCRALKEFSLPDKEAIHCRINQATIRVVPFPIPTSDHDQNLQLRGRYLPKNSTLPRDLAMALGKMQNIRELDLEINDFSPRQIQDFETNIISSQFSFQLLQIDVDDEVGSKLIRETRDLKSLHLRTCFSSAMLKAAACCHSGLERLAIQETFMRLYLESGVLLAMGRAGIPSQSMAIGDIATNFRFLKRLMIDEPVDTELWQDMVKFIITPTGRPAMRNLTHLSVTIWRESVIKRYEYEEGNNDEDEIEDGEENNEEDGNEDEDEDDLPLLARFIHHVGREVTNLERICIKQRSPGYIDGTRLSEGAIDIQRRSMKPGQRGFPVTLHD